MNYYILKEFYYKRLSVILWSWQIKSEMKNLKVLFKTALFGILILFFPTHLFSQSNNFTQNITIVVPQVLLVNAVDASGSPNSISLAMSASQAGAILNRGLGTTYVQVSSIIASGQNHRIQVSYDQIPDGTYLKVTGILPPSGNGGGTFGTSTGKVTLSTIPQNIFTGIGSCYTGIAPGDGYELDWVFIYKSVSTYSLIKAVTGYNTTITLTISTGG